VKGSLQRASAVVEGRMPDRAPLFELLRNDAVLSHFAGEPLALDNAEGVVFRAYAPAIDATRPVVRIPRAEETVTLPDGRRRREYRWTSWTEPVAYPDAESYAAGKRSALARAAQARVAETAAEKQARAARFLADVAEHRRRLGEVFFFPSAPAVGLMGAYGEVGLEAFSYYLADCPEVIDEVLESQTASAVDWIEHLPADHGLTAVFCGDDIAFKSGPLMSPVWLRGSFFPRLARVLGAYHARGIKVLFHSDGNLNPILDDLVEAGIDGLNPIEVVAGMDVAEIHRRHPRLFLCGGIDVSNLLPYGRPPQIRDAVRRALDAAEGRIMIGSSTELADNVPLENYLALRDAVLAYEY
jgi:hypothetical protein